MANNTFGLDKETLIKVYKKLIRPAWEYRISPTIGRGLKVKILEKKLGVVQYTRYSLVKVEILDGTENKESTLSDAGFTNANNFVLPY